MKPSRSAACARATDAARASDEDCPLRTGTRSSTERRGERGIPHCNRARGRGIPGGWAQAETSADARDNPERIGGILLILEGLPPHWMELVS
ncbi:hypothetical protein GCM10017608_26460 [Agromyces luteolus]|nr:hypothetical protein GCM10017608_26460 [Agromyces luteolus]